MSARRHPEQDLQIALVEFLGRALPWPWLVFSTKNHGEQRTKKWHGVHRAMGVKKGMSDLWVVGPSPHISDAMFAAVIELKRPNERLPSGRMSKRKAKPRSDQAEVLAQLTLCGAYTLVSNDFDDVIGWLRALGVPLRGSSGYVQSPGAATARATGDDAQ